MQKEMFNFILETCLSSSVRCVFSLRISIYIFDKTLILNHSLASLCVCIVLEVYVTTGIWNCV